MSMPIAPEAPVGVGKERFPELLWALVAVAFLFLNAITFPLGATIRSPGDQTGLRFIALIPAVGFAAYGLWRSGKCVWWMRIYYAIAIGFALMFMVFPMDMNFRATGNYLWPEGVIIVVGLCAWGWKAHQQWLTIGIPSFLVWWFWGAFSAPTTTLPTEQTINGVSLRLTSVTPNGCVAAVSRGNEKVLDKNLQASSFVNSHMMLWNIRGSMTGTLFTHRPIVPKWCKSVNIDVSVPCWPQHPSGTAKIDLQSLTAQSHDNVVIKHVQWLNSDHKGIRFTYWFSKQMITAHFYKDGGAPILKFARGIDDQGNVYDLELVDNPRGPTTAQIEGTPIGTKSIEIQAISIPELMTTSNLVFHFEHVPIDRSHPY